MQMIDIADFYSLVTAKAPFAPIPEVENALRKAGAMICKRLRLWNVEASFTVATPDEEPIYSDPDSRIEAIEQPMFNGRAITSITPRQLDRLRSNWSTLEPGEPVWLVQMMPSTFRLVPQASGVLTARLVLYPSPDCTMLPEFLMTDMQDEMQDGAVGSLLTESTNAEYSNPAMGSMALARLNDALGRRSAGALRPQVRAPLRAKPSFF